MKYASAYAAASLAVCMGFVLSACSILQNADQTKIVVQIATMKVVEGGEDRHIRALRIKEIASDAKLVLDASSVSVDLLAGAARNRVANLHLAASDQLLANLLIDSVAQDLKLKIGEGAIPDTSKFRVNQVLGWVAEAASFY